MKKNLFVRNSMKKPPPRLESVTTHFLRKLSHPPPNIKQSIPNSLTSKTNFAHYDYKPSNSKKNFFKSVPLFPLPRNPHFQSGTRPARPQERFPRRCPSLACGSAGSMRRALLARVHLYVYMRAPSPCPPVCLSPWRPLSTPGIPPPRPFSSSFAPFSVKGC